MKIWEIFLDWKKKKYIYIYIYTAIKVVRNLFRLEKETKGIKDIINRFEHEEEKNYHKPVRVSNFWSNNYIEDKSNSDRNITLSFEEILIKLDHI